MALPRALPCAAWLKDVKSRKLGWFRVRAGSILAEKLSKRKAFKTLFNCHSAAGRRLVNLRESAVDHAFRQFCISLSYFRNLHKCSLLLIVEDPRPKIRRRLSTMLRI